MTERAQHAAARRHRTSAAVWAILLAAGFAWGGRQLCRAGFDALPASRAAWLDGSAGRALGSALKLPAQGAVDTVGAALRYRLLGDAGEQVALGCPQWMFYRDGLRPQPGVAADVLDARLRLMRYWTRQLRARQVAVLVVAVPDKSRIEAAHLCGQPVSGPMRERIDIWQQALREEGVPFVDLRETLAGRPQPVFFRTDVHMNGYGAALAAQAVASAALPLLGGAKGAQSFRVEGPGQPQPRMGDLIELSGLARARPGWRPALERVAPLRIEPVRGGGLLDDGPPVEVLLAGSSNGRRSNFAERLGMGLGREVWNVSIDGGQFAKALIAAMNTRAAWPSTVRLVIWEFSEYALSLPLTDDEKAALRAIAHDGRPA